MQQLLSAFDAQVTVAVICGIIASVLALVVHIIRYIQLRAQKRLTLARHRKPARSKLRLFARDYA